MVFHTTQIGASNQVFFLFANHISMLPIQYASLILGVALSSTDVWLIMLIFNVLGSLTER